MKIIISHDVDHLYRDDHYYDLIYPKLWTRESFALLRMRIDFQEWYLRMLSPFQRVRHHIDDVMNFDMSHSVPSTFFFGMANGLGMSYKQQKAIPVIKTVYANGFDVGVHGIAYDDVTSMQTEYDDFKKISTKGCFGIRQHYVRYNESTFEKLGKMGYLFDTSEFNKTDGYLIKAPYKIGNMWEFPLTIMDGYLPMTLDAAKAKTLEILDKATAQHIKYATILFHDYLYCHAYSIYKHWYEWLIQYLMEDVNFSFISYREAIIELENGANRCQI